ncbi:unnamed protein product [Rotaria magnacalcarata]|uniref:Nudix hydrolase domain-containing protein n=5 Tax=Rotaria magnacalcarata TaxID=392030 RepID=A0A816MEQ9_9BILA|nr:unnamed protein product [Rotaria magnacalcarata]
MAFDFRSLLQHMPFNIYHKYKPSDGFKKNIIREIQKYLGFQVQKYKKEDYDSIVQSEFEEEYNSIVILLIDIEKEGCSSQNNYSHFTFEQQRDKSAEDMKDYAIPEILEKLQTLRQQRIKNHSKVEEWANINDEDWIKCKPKDDIIAKYIWKIWCKEREQRPRAGIIFFYLSKSGGIKVLLIKYNKNNCIIYGFPKGKIEFGETKIECARRETFEEIGVDVEDINNYIKNSVPIKKLVFDDITDTLKEHYYFLVQVPSTDISFTLNENEVTNVEWRSVYHLPSSLHCAVVNQIVSADLSKESNYFMVICNCKSTDNTSLVEFIIYYFDTEDQLRSTRDFSHITKEVAYNRMLHELSTMDNRFYEDWNARKLQRQPNKSDWKTFAVPTLAMMLSTLYMQRESYLPSNDEFVDNEYFESNETDDKLKIVTPAIAKLRMLCANCIWRLWCYERLWGPRVGVILVSTMVESAEKVLVISYISDKPEKNLNVGFPKGKPNIGETIREGGFRELLEEGGINKLRDSLSAAFENGKIIKKYPYIGSINRRQCRTHYYVIAAIASECTPSEIDSREIWDAEWHSIYTLPCCDTCKIVRKFTFVKGDEIPINYHMVTLRDIDGRNSAVLELLAYVDEMNVNRNAFDKYNYTHRQCNRKIAINIFDEHGTIGTETIIQI